MRTAGRFLATESCCFRSIEGCREDIVLITGEDKLHEECGVFGIISPGGGSVARDIYYGLTALQHRGQESAGIAVSDTHGSKGNLSIKKGMGLVSEVFSMSDLSGLCGNIGVGHVRYSTTGGSRLENSQPIAMNYIKGSLALVHNGNIMNARELKAEQLLRGIAHYTSSDSEVLSYEIINERISSGSIEEAVQKAAMKLKGGYACIIMSPRKLVGIRDPYGIKPLIIGKRDDSYILASESAAVRSVGGRIIRDAAPGEIVTITGDGIRSGQLPLHKTPAHCVFEYIYFARPDSVIDGVPVHEARIMAGRALAKRYDVPADVVIGVPDSGLKAAEGYALESGIPFALGLHKNSYVGRSFIKPTDNERKSAVHMKLSVMENVVRGKRVVLIDDSIVRGNTMRQIVEMLKKAGADKVHVRISSPPFLYPCFYGTDVPSSGQLIASKHSADEVCRSIGADSLGYLDLKDLSLMTGGLQVCSACFDNNYPVGHGL